MFQKSNYYSYKIDYKKVVVKTKVFTKILGATIMDKSSFTDDNLDIQTNLQSIMISKMLLQPAELTISKTIQFT